MKQGPKTFDEWMRFAHAAKAEAHERGLPSLERQAHELERRLLVCQADASSPEWLEIKEGQRALFAAYVRQSTLPGPAPGLTARLERSVRTLALELGKEVQFECSATCAQCLDQVATSLREPLYSCLLAAARNSLDHSPMSKLMIQLRVSQDASGLRIEFADTGAGIDPSAVRVRVLEKGIHSQATLAQLPDEEVVQLLFIAGLSLKRQTSVLSGRGYGLDIVRDSVESLGGRARLSSRLGEGTTLTIDLPASSFERAKSA